MYTSLHSAEGPCHIPPWSPSSLWVVTLLKWHVWIQVCIYRRSFHSVTLAKPKSKPKRKADQAPGWILGRIEFDFQNLDWICRRKFFVQCSVLAVDFIKRKDTNSSTSDEFMKMTPSGTFQSFQLRKTLNHRLEAGRIEHENITVLLIFFFPFPKHKQRCTSRSRILVLTAP